jgi:SAM-dependent methyltransferase
MGPINPLDHITREGDQRLHPSITNPNWLVLRSRRRILEQWVRQLPPSDLSVLDVGGRIQPYRHLLTGQLGAYVSIDPVRTPLVNVIGRAENLPFQSDLFDLVLCTQVMQYIPEPFQVAREIARVLKPGGFFFLTVPSAYPIDSDEECWRFLPAGIRQLLSPFQEVDIVAEGGSVAGFFRTCNVCFNIFARYSAIRSLLTYSLFPALNAMGAVLESASAGRNQQFAVNYSVRARK